MSWHRQNWKQILDAGLDNNNAVLDFRGKQVSDDNVTVIAKKIHRSKVESVYLGDNPIGDKAILDLCLILPLHPLKSLSLNKTAMTDVGLKNIASILSQSNLTVLDISENAITAHGAKALACVLPYSQVKSLHMVRTKIGEEGAQALLEVLPYTHITSIHLVDSGADPLTLKKIHEIMCENNARKERGEAPPPLPDKSPATTAPLPVINQAETQLTIDAERRNAALNGQGM